MQPQNHIGGKKMKKLFIRTIATMMCIFFMSMQVLAASVTLDIPFPDPDMMRGQVIEGYSVSLDYFYGNDYVAKRVIELAEGLRVQRRDGATEDELYDYLRDDLKDGIQRYDLYEYIKDRLNSQEQALFNSNPVLGLLAMSNGLLAINYAEQYYYSYVLHNDNGDAFRHILWTYAMVIDVGYAFAKQWSDAHEYGAVGQPAIERQMDLHNNAIGLRLGQTYPGTILHRTFINRSREKVRNGDARIIINNSLYSSDSFGEK